MSQVDQALQTLTYWGRALIGVFLGIFGIIEQFIRRLLTQLAVPEGLQSLVILALVVLFILAVLRLFGGLFRVLLIVFLILLILHVLIPNAGL